MRKLILQHNGIVLVLAFLISRILVALVHVEMDFGALYRNWQYLDVSTLKGHLLRGLWYDHTQPPLFNLFLGCVLKAAGAHAFPAFVAIFKLLTLANAGLLLLILKRVLPHPWLPLLISLLYLLSPATIIFENELFYTSFVTLLLLLALWYLLELEKGITFNRALGLFLPLLLICLTRSMYHLVWLALLSAVIWAWYRKRNGSTLILGFSIATILLLGGWYYHNKATFGSFSASTWMGMNMARNVFHDVPVQQDSSRIASIEPFSRISVYYRFLSPDYSKRYLGLNDKDLIDELKNDSFINEKQVGYIEVSRLYGAACQQEIRQHPLHYGENVVESAIIFFTPATRYPTTEYLSFRLGWYDLIYSFNLSHFARGKRQRRIAETASAIPKFLLYLFVFGFLIRQTVRTRKVPGGLPTLFISFIIGYIFVVSSLFEHYENMRFRYEAEPLFLILAATALAAHPLLRRWGININFRPGTAHD